MLTYLRKNMKSIMIIVAVLFAASMFYGLGMRGMQKRETGKKGGIATINGREIDPLRFNQNLSRLAGSMGGRVKPQELAYLQMLALNQVIDYTLMLNEAGRNVSASGDEVNGALNQIMQMNKIPSMSEFEKVLKSNGFDVGQFKKMVKEDILVQKMIGKIRGSVAITPDDLREVKAEHILITPKVAVSSKESGAKKAEAEADLKARVAADQILARIKKGENFEKLAKLYSDDPGSAAKGGDLGYFSVGMMVPEFEKAVFALKPGEVSGIVKTPFGYHIIKLIDTRLRIVAEKGKDIKEVILQQKQEGAFRNWMYSLKQKAKIEITNPALKAYDLRLSGQTDAAIIAYNSILSENPADPYLHLLLGDTYEQKGDMELAIAEYVKAQSLNSSDPNIAITLGRAYEKQKNAKNDRTGKFRKLALEELGKASLLAGENKGVHKELSDIYKELKEFVLKAAEDKKISQIEAREKFEEEIKKRSETNK